MGVLFRDKKYASREVSIADHYVRFNDYKAEVSSEDAIILLRNDDFEMLSGCICPFNSETWTKNYKKLFWDANADTFSGFGSVTINVVKVLRKNGIDVCFSGNQIDREQFPDEEFNSDKKLFTPDCVTIQYRQPGQYRPKMAEMLFGYTPWETTRIPASWVEVMNKVKGIFVPCQQNKEAFINSGVKVPIYLFHHGVNVDEYPYFEREERPYWTFSSFGRLSVRKGTDLVLRAFNEEFRGVKDVRLILKTSDNLFPPLGFIKDERIQVICGPVERAKMYNLLKNTDCFLFPSRGEGFGLPAIEAMSTGLLVIMTNWSGLSEFANKDDNLLLDYKMVKADNFSKMIYNEDCGEWSEPDYDQLRYYMRWSYENRNKAREIGKKASERIFKDWSWDVVVKKFISQLDLLI